MAHRCGTFLLIDYECAEQIKYERVEVNYATNLPGTNFYHRSNVFNNLATFVG